MRSLLRTIRSKPKAVRNQYALGLAITFTGVVALVWIVTGMSLDEKTRETVVETDRPAFSNLTKQIKEQWATVRQAIQTDTDVASSTEPVAATDPTTLVLTPETVAEVAGASASTTPVTTSEPPVYVQIATSSSIGTSTSATVTATTTR